MKCEAENCVSESICSVAEACVLAEKQPEYNFLEDLERRLEEAKARQKVLNEKYIQVQNEFQNNGTMIRSLEIVIASQREKSHQS